MWLCSGDDGDSGGDCVVRYCLVFVVCGGIPGIVLHQFLKAPEGRPPGDEESTVVQLSGGGVRVADV